jgi:glyoxylase-like metal-dependent hydrolase (beta-lactamase superfamily II)
VFRDAAAGVLFAGDHILPHITPSIGFEAALPRSPLADYLDSLALVLALPDTALLPAHGPVTASTHARIHELLEHHRVRLDHSRLAVAGGSSSVIDVARVLRWTRRERTFDELSLFDRMLAITETAAHLEVLVAAGTIVADTSGEVTCYSAPTATSAAPTDPR